MTDEVLEICKRLKYERLTRGIGQKELSAMAGLSINQIGYTETGVRNPTLETILKICKAMGLEPARLFQAENYPTIEDYIAYESKSEIMYKNQWVYCKKKEKDISNVGYYISEKCPDIDLQDEFQTELLTGCFKCHHCHPHFSDIARLKKGETREANKERTLKRLKRQ